MKQKQKQYRFVYSFDKNETPDSFHVRATNITNAKKKWESSKTETDILLAIFCDNQEIWVNQKKATNYNLSVI